MSNEPRGKPPCAPRVESDNAYEDVHEHPTEWPDEVSVEPSVPHPGADPVETTTEARPDHPDRSGRGRRQPRAARAAR